MANIRKRGENSFILTVETGYDSKGRRKRRYKTIKVEDKSLLKTTKKLRDYLDVEFHKFKTEVQAGEYIAPEKLTLETFVVDWEEKYASRELAETTLANYLSHIRNHILPAIGHMRLDQVKPLHIINMLNDMKRKDADDKPLSERTKQDTYLTIRNIFERAVEWQIIKDNPVKNVKKPRITEEKDLIVYDEDEIESLFISVENEPFHWRMFLTLILAAGLRRSECLGLEWSKLDLDKGTVDITQVITKGRNGAVIKGPKSKKSKRLLSLPESVVEELKFFQLQWKKEKMRMRDKWIEKDRQWVFCNEDGTHFHPDTPTTWWTRFTKRADVRYIKLHDLRHTSATLLINQGVHAKIISERLGHSDIRVTMNTYGHVLRKADQEAANKLNGLFSKKQSASNS
ncbi:site-specific integrase [Bacillus sp. ISL-35]|uniref:tyrosine-type recombinase/integrase n=1 Tax=Bacillus sp. ISL-35 TaxID=2819122 RepID=UPI001BE62D01|nr:site-specific integrase [Bacillus sp. ISL-35]MBT2680011.1 site-specific integrase [Bacillus sp. ISL-35]MBT2703013.1 site-specific integrase [Chryseobacterium sp. ISL-80]